MRLDVGQRVRTPRGLGIVAALIVPEPVQPVSVVVRLDVCAMHVVFRPGQLTIVDDDA